MNFKQMAAEEALKYVKSGMILGLGTGSTTAHFIERLGEEVRQGKINNVLAVPTSVDTEEKALSSGIKLTSLSEHPRLDLAVDGADEVDGHLNMIKGLGRALLREKIVEMHARRFVVIVDESKVVEKLGRGPLPVEIVPFSADLHVRWLNTLGCRAELWLEEGEPVVTDNGNYLARCWYQPDGIDDPYLLAHSLEGRPGIVEHGLFLDMASEVIVAGVGGIRLLSRN